MSSKRVQFDEADEDTFGNAARADDVKKKFKNSLDSDEEDDEVEDKKYNLLNPDDVEGQEDKTIEYDGDIKITPFNMEDEMEDGHFDKDGMFIFSKDKAQIRDNWLDNIDWVKVRPTTASLEDSRDSGASGEAEKVDVLSVYGDMLGIMRPGETVLSCIKRLGGGKRDSTINRWKKKKQQEETGLPYDN